MAGILELLMTLYFSSSNTLTEVRSQEKMEELNSWTITA